MDPIMPRNRRLTALALSTSLCLSACAIGPDYLRPAMPMPAAFKEETHAPLTMGPPRPAHDPLAVGPFQPETDVKVALQPANPQDEASKGKWWEAFGDADLNALEEQVASHNQNIAAADAAFHQARALVAQARAGYFPELDVNGSMSRSSQGAGASTSTGSTLGGVIHNTYSASLQASWVPDIWGSVRRQVEGAKAGAQASAASLAAATLSAQGDLAIDYMSLRISDLQKQALDRSVESYTRSLQLTQNQYNAGIVSRADMLQAKVQLETAQAQAADIGVTRAQFEHAIAVLVGKAPADFSLAVITTAPALPEVPTTLPSQLLERRPDIASAERKVKQANAQIGVAEAAYFPGITLSASGGYTSSQLFQWFMMPNRFWSIGPALVETLFDAGLRAAQTEAAIAAYDQTVASYRQTVLAAFQEVEDNLAALRQLAQEAEVLDAAVKDAQASMDVAMNQYKAGTVSYLNVTTAQTAALNSEISALNVRKARLTSAATLIEALGGGWNVNSLSATEVTHGEAGPLSILPPSVKK